MPAGALRDPVPDRDEAQLRRSLPAVRMAKPTPAALRRRLRLLVAEVAAGNEDAVAFDEAAAALAALRDAELGTREDDCAGAVAAETKASSETAVPEQFLCRISSEIMRDPVVLASGQVILLSPCLPLGFDWIAGPFPWLKSRYLISIRWGFMLGNKPLFRNPSGQRRMRFVFGFFPNSDILSALTVHPPLQSRSPPPRSSCSHFRSRTCCRWCDV
jgi:hypothetical protein